MLDFRQLLTEKEGVARISGGDKEGDPEPVQIGQRTDRMTGLGIGPGDLQ
jgi:hypothetical protein